MNYAIFQAVSSRLVCVGTAEYCAQELGVTPDKVEMWAKYPGSCTMGLAVLTIEPSNPLRCPCETCIKSPRTKGVVSASCDKAECAKWAKWAALYWNRLRRKYWRR
jgi:hypothetical protein